MDIKAAASRQKAMRSLERGEPEIAMLHLDNACHLQPQDLVLKSYRAYAAALARRCPVNAALKLIHELSKVAADQEVAELYLLLGHLRRHQGQRKRAAYWYQRTLAVEPGHSEALALLRRLILHERRRSPWRAVLGLFASS